MEINKQRRHHLLLIGHSHTHARTYIHTRDYERHSLARDGDTHARTHARARAYTHTLLTRTRWQHAHTQTRTCTRALLSATHSHEMATCTHARARAHTHTQRVYECHWHEMAKSVTISSEYMGYLFANLFARARTHTQPCQRRAHSSLVSCEEAGLKSHLTPSRGGKDDESRGGMRARIHAAWLPGGCSWKR